jgi:beta-phosphoglucomutase-like phosphatase (HAD superfamily)
MNTIIFDCDGTLVDSEILSNEVLVEAVAEYGLSLSVDEAVASFRDCVVVEDSLPGIRAGLAAGMRVFAFQPHGVDPRIPRDVTVVKELRELHSVF